jgi:hypothetical protein
MTFCRTDSWVTYNYTKTTPISFICTLGNPSVPSSKLLSISNPPLFVLLRDTTVGPCKHFSIISWKIVGSTKRGRWRDTTRQSGGRKGFSSFFYCIIVAAGGGPSGAYSSVCFSRHPVGTFLVTSSSLLALRQLCVQQL